MFTLIMLLVISQFILSFMASIIIIYKFFCKDEKLDTLERKPKRKLEERK